MRKFQSTSPEISDWTSKRICRRWAPSINQFAVPNWTWTGLVLVAAALGIFIFRPKFRRMEYEKDRLERLSLAADIVH